MGQRRRTPLGAWRARLATLAQPRRPLTLEEIQALPLPPEVPRQPLLHPRLAPIVLDGLLALLDRRRCAELAQRRGFDGPAVATVLAGDPDRLGAVFDWLFIEHAPDDSSWLLDESGARVAWLSRGKTIASATLRIHARQPVSKRQLDHYRKVLRDEAVRAVRAPKPRGRPRGQPDRHPRLMIQGFDRATYQQLAQDLEYADRVGLGRGRRLFKLLDCPLMYRGAPFSDPNVRALFAEISTRPTAPEILRRIRQKFRPAE